MSNIYVTKSFLPPLEEYILQLEKIWKSGHLTNQGPLLQEFETKMQEYLGVQHFHFLTNGTLALQLAISSLDISEGEIITTPFSYVATTSSILWERCTPVFVDIESENFMIDVTKIEEKITSKTKAILAVHVFGYANNVEKIQNIANKYHIKTIYDGAHCFGTKYKGKSLLSYGDVSTLSFHATKLFHTIEGGACIVNDDAVSEKLNLQKRFGHLYEDYSCLGINAKASEFQAAMGLTNFSYIQSIIAERKKIAELYDSELLSSVQRPKKQKDLEFNYAYYPVVFETEGELLRIFEKLNDNGVFPRRYFYPSLNTLPYVTYQACPVSEDISKRIACLPLYPSLTEDEVLKICSLIK